MTNRQESFASPSPLPVVVAQHTEESAMLRHTRSVLVRAPHVKLLHLGRLDERIAAHLDGVAVAGEFGRKLCEAALETPGTGEVFAAAVRAIEDKNQQRLDRLFAVVEAVPESERGLLSAFGWVSAQLLQGTIKTLLSANDPFRRRVGIAACALHRVDPGPILETALASSEAPLRARALRCAGEIGRVDLLHSCVEHLTDDDPACRFAAAYSSVLLGDRRKALDMLAQIARQSGPYQIKALALTLFTGEVDYGRVLVKQISAKREDMRTLIRATGYAGEIEYIPWLITHMADDKFARLAGEAFSFITGADLAWLDLERKPPEGVEFGPNDDPNDDNVALDEDESLPWPDQAKVQAWWNANSQRFQPGGRYFVGEVPTLEHCLSVLKEGYQRQRYAAALYRSLLKPGTPLFNVAAPAWRQKRLLDQMR